MKRLIAMIMALACVCGLALANDASISQNKGMTSVELFNLEYSAMQAEYGDNFNEDIYAEAKAGEGPLLDELISGLNCYNIESILEDEEFKPLYITVGQCIRVVCAFAIGLIVGCQYMDAAPELMPDNIQFFLPTMPSGVNDSLQPQYVQRC